MKHVEKLKAGLACLPDDFYYELCFMCAGAAEYKQTYNVGCGGGYYQTLGPCSFCDATGLASKKNPDSKPSRSVMLQVLAAAEKPMETSDV
jgi:hypothetical protein